MKKFGLLLIPIMAMPFLVNCNKGIAKYTITWQDADGNVLEVDENVEAGTMPHFDGVLPLKPHDETSYYTFSWSPEVKVATSSVTYTPVYRKVDIMDVDAYVRVVVPDFIAFPLIEFDCNSPNIEIDWGDDSNSVSPSYHIYGAPGEYDVKIKNITRLNITRGQLYIKEIYLGEEISTILDSAYEYCSSLISINIPSQVTALGEDSFGYCSSLTSINIPSSVTQIGTEEETAFPYCSGLASITVDEDNPNYDSRDNCNAIITKTKVGDIEANTLIQGCKNTVIPENVTAIGSHAFLGCYLLTNIYIPKGVTSIKTSAFRNCPNVTSFVVDEANPNYDSRNNCNALITKTEIGTIDANTLIQGFKNTIIPDGVTCIFYNAFAYCYPLTTIAIPSSVTWLGDHAFSDCYSLSLVDLTSYTNPDKESIPHCDKNDSFENCSEDLKFKVKNEEMAHAFADSGHWWSNDINDYIY